MKIYKIKKTLIPHKCQGCNELIIKGSSAIWISIVWGNFSRKGKFHNEKCLSKFKNVRKNY